MSKRPYKLTEIVQIRFTSDQMKVIEQAYLQYMTQNECVVAKSSFMRDAVMWKVLQDVGLANVGVK